MWGTLLGLAGAGIQGGLSYSQEQDRIKRQNALNKEQNLRIDELQTGVAEDIEKSKQLTTGRAGDIMNRYSMAENPQQGQGYSNMYTGVLQQGEQRVQRLDDLDRKLEASRATDEDEVFETSDIWSAVGQGLLGGITGAATGSKIGQQLESDKFASATRQKFLDEAGITLENTWYEELFNPAEWDWLQNIGDTSMSVDTGVQFGPQEQASLFDDNTSTYESNYDPYSDTYSDPYANLLETL